jgi:hypothetical protein
MEAAKKGDEVAQIRVMLSHSFFVLCVLHNVRVGKWIWIKQQNRENWFLDSMRQPQFRVASFLRVSKGVHVDLL